MSILEEIFGIDSRMLDDNYTPSKDVSYHECGHAITGLHFGVPIDRVTIRPSVFEKLSGSEALTVYNMDALMQVPPGPRVVMALAGCIAQAKFSNADYKSLFVNGGQSDLETAVHFTKMAGGDRAYLDSAIYATQNMVDKLWSPLVVLAERLQTVYTMDYTAIKHTLRIQDAKDIG